VWDGFGCLSRVLSLFSLCVHAIVARAFNHEKQCKLQFMLFGVTVGSFLDRFQLLLSDVHDCDQCGMYLGRHQTVLVH
jgi:hypothetical protein